MAQDLGVELPSSQQSNDSQTSLVRRVVNAAVQVASAVLPHTPSKKGSQAQDGGVAAQSGSPIGSQAGATASVNLTVRTGESPTNKQQQQEGRGNEEIKENQIPIDKHPTAPSTTYQPSSRPNFNVGRKRHRSYWQAEEESYLLDGVERYGIGNWSVILGKYPFASGRTNVDLKDKYRNLQIQQSKRAPRYLTNIRPEALPYRLRIVDVEFEDGTSTIQFKYSNQPHRWQAARYDLEEWDDMLNEYFDSLTEKCHLIEEAIQQAKETGRIDRNESTEDIFHETREDSATALPLESDKQKSTATSNNKKNLKGEAKQTELSDKKDATDKRPTPSKQSEKRKPTGKGDSPVIEIQQPTNAPPPASKAQSKDEETTASKKTRFGKFYKQPGSDAEPGTDEQETKPTAKRSLTGKESTDREKMKKRQAVEERLKKLQYKRG